MRSLTESRVTVRATAFPLLPSPPRNTAVPAVLGLLRLRREVIGGEFVVRRRRRVRGGARGMAVGGEGVAAEVSRATPNMPYSRVGLHGGKWWRPQVRQVGWLGERWLFQS